jgi:hypothetical protein
MVITKTDPLHYIAAVVAGSDPHESELQIEGCSTVAQRWPELLLLAKDQGLGPLLLKRLQQTSSGLANSEVLAPLLVERNEAAVHYMLASQVQKQVQRAFEEQDVPCLWLKGIVLAQTVYAAPELRPMVDVDVLVPYEARNDALAIAQAIGFSLDTPLLFDGREGLKHHFHLESSVFRPVRLELHFRMLGTMDRLLRVEDQQWFWHHKEELKSATGGTMTVLTPEAHLLYLCAHAMLQHGEYDLRLLRLYDLDRLIAETPDFDWELCIAGAVQLRWTYAVERALALTQEYFGTMVPEEAMAELIIRRPSEERTEHARRRQTRRTTTESVVYDLAAMGWTDRMRSACRILAPPPSYMRWRYGLTGNRQLPGAYVRRMGHIASDVIDSLRHRVRRYQ